MFNGRRQPSCDGTSRMTRESQVRICERLGVKFPGPTRQKRRGQPRPRVHSLPVRLQSGRKFKASQRVAMCQTRPFWRLFDHFVRGVEEKRRDRDAKRLRGLKIDRHPELVWPLDR
jgi:hypothetical protein